MSTSLSKTEAQEQIRKAHGLYFEAECEEQAGCKAKAGKIRDEASKLESEVSNAGYDWNVKTGDITNVPPGPVKKS